MLTLVRDGVLDSFSVAFRPVRDRRENGVIVRAEASLSEVSLVGQPAYEGALVAGIRAAGRPSAPYPPGRRGSAARTTRMRGKTMFFDDSNLAIESMRFAPNPRHAAVALLDSTSGDLVGADAERFTQLTEHAEALRQRQRDQEPHRLSELVRRYRDGDSRLAVEGGSVGMARCPRRCSVRLLRRARAAAIGVAACSRQPVAVDAQRREPGGARERPRPRAGGDWCSRNGPRWRRPTWEPASDLRRTDWRRPAICGGQQVIPTSAPTGYSGAGSAVHVARRVPPWWIGEGSDHAEFDGVNPDVRCKLARAGAWSSLTSEAMLSTSLGEVSAAHARIIARNTENWRSSRRTGTVAVGA